MRISIIAALSRNRVIGARNRLPWHLPADLARFKRLTLGRCVIMGRKTFDSIGRSLPRRTNIVVTRGAASLPPGVVVARSLTHALEHASGEHASGEEVFIAGGAEVYRQALPLADRLYLTVIEAEIEGDAFFPELDRSAWSEVERQERPAEGAALAHSFVTYERAVARGGETPPRTPQAEGSVAFRRAGP